MSMRILTIISNCTCFFLISHSIIGGGSSYGGQGMDLGRDNGIGAKGIDGESSEFSSSRERIIHSSRIRASAESSPRESKKVLSTGTR